MRFGEFLYWYTIMCVVVWVTVSCLVSIFVVDYFSFDATVSASIMQPLAGMIGLVVSECTYREVWERIRE
jgi:hypothetical protein